MRRFEWTEQRVQALALARTGHYTQAEIAWRVGTTRRTVEGWARRPAWKARYQELVASSFAEWQTKLRGDAEAARIARSPSYTRKPRGTRSHRTRWYQRQPAAEDAPIHSYHPQKSAEEILADMHQRLERQRLAPQRPWWE